MRESRVPITNTIEHRDQIDTNIENTITRKHYNNYPTMSSFTVVLIRHGQTEYNVAGLLQGSTVDSPLTETGLADANKVGVFLKDVPWAKAYASDLYRAHHTCNIILSHNQRVQLEPKLSSLIREVNYGVREGRAVTLSADECRAIIAEEKGIPAEDVPDAAETMQDIKERIQNLFTMIQGELSSHPEGERLALCVSHGGFIKRVLRFYCGVDLEKMENCGVTAIKVSEVNGALQFKVDEKYCGFVEYKENPDLASPTFTY
jgi:probable phosphoglycerate mutase